MFDKLKMTKFLLWLKLHSLNRKQRRNAVYIGLYVLSVMTLTGLIALGQYAILMWLSGIVTHLVLSQILSWMAIISVTMTITKTVISIPKLAKRVRVVLLLSNNLNQEKDAEEIKVRRIMKDKSMATTGHLSTVSN